MKVSSLQAHLILARCVEAGLLLVLPLVFCRAFAEQFTYPKKFLALLLIATGLAAWLLARIWDRIGRMRYPGLAAPLTAFSFAILLSIINSPVPRFSFHDSLYLLCGPGCLWLLVSLGGRHDAWSRLASLAVLAGTAVACVALLQWWGYDPLLFGKYRIDWGHLAARMRLYSTFGNPNFVAGYLIGAVFPALALGTAASKVWTKTAWYLSAGLMLGAIFGTGSRGAWLGLAGGVFAAAWAGMQGRDAAAETGPVSSRKRSRRLSHTIVALVILITLAITLAVSSSRNPAGRMEGRVFLWRAGWPMFYEHPLFGSGLGTYTLRSLDLQAAFLGRHPEYTKYWTNNRLLHNDPMQLLLETGVIGLAAFVWILWAYALRAQRVLAFMSSRPSQLLIAASAGGVTAMLIDSIFNYQLALPPTLILIFALMAFPFMAVDPGSRAESPPHLPANCCAAPRRGGVPLFRVAASAAALLGWASLLILESQHARAEYNYKEARALEERGDMLAAEEGYRRGLQHDPLHGRLHFGLARVLFLDARYEEALNEVQTAERTYADSHTWVLKGHILKQSNKPEPALSAFRRALVLDPTLTSVWAEIEELERK